MQKLTDPQEPDTMARIAGKDLYGTIVGTLRRVELWRLANAWGMEFPAGATKDYMLPFFMRLEAEGKNPLKPPGMVITDTAQLRQREVKFTAENHAEKDSDPLPEVVQPKPISDYEKELMAAPMGQLKKICKMRGITQSPRDRKADLVARIIATIEGQPSEQDTSGRDQRPT